jgi:AraC family transcriptional regulator
MASSAETTLNQSAALARRPALPIAENHSPAWLHPDLESRSIVDISPSGIVRRHSAAWSGLHVETVHVMRHTPFEYGFRVGFCDTSRFSAAFHRLPSSPTGLLSARRI